MAEDLQLDYYAVVGVADTADAQEIRTAYRKASLAVHPDRNPGDQAAADKFHKLTIAFEFLSDPARRAKFDAERAAKAARAARFAGLDSKRKALAEDLAAREADFKRRKTEDAQKKSEQARKLEEIRAAGAKLRKAKEDALASSVAPRPTRPTDIAEMIPERTVREDRQPSARRDDVPSLEHLNDPGATLRLKWSKKKAPSLTNSDRLTAKVVSSGIVDEGDIESLLLAKTVADPSSKKASAVILLRSLRKAKELAERAAKDPEWQDVDVGLVES